uniref:Uncharacterized protein n=1 Tax=Setaria viridis TaxID=4556 RepID=A0A4U6UHD8_SETVI|nr:hypothetical protein SEVIR_5G080200v2 [Setaria viridis]
MVPLAYPRTDYQDGTRFLWGILAFRGQSMRKLHVKHFFSLTMGSDSLAETGNSLFAKLVSQGVGGHTVNWRNQYLGNTFTMMMFVPDIFLDCFASFFYLGKSPFYSPHLFTLST